jgi:hypothetical protein
MDQTMPLPNQTKHPPNILLIMMDDMGWGDLRSHGNAIADTPNLDALAQSGLEADQFCVSPVCSPTRASVLTGRYYPRTGVSLTGRGYETIRSDETHNGRTSLAGRSLKPLLESTVDPTMWPDGIVNSVSPGNHSLRTKQWRFTRYADGSEEL